jgi:hypothetical protein
MDLLFALVLLNTTSKYTVNSIDFEANLLSSYTLENATHLEKGCFVYNNDDIVYAVLNIYQDASALSTFGRYGNQVSRWHYQGSVLDNLQYDQLKSNYYTAEYDMSEEINKIVNVNTIDGTRKVVGKLNDVVEVCMSSYNQRDGIYFLAANRDVLIYNTSDAKGDYKRIDVGGIITSMAWNRARNSLYVWIRGTEVSTQVLLEVNIDTQRYAEILTVSRVVSDDGVNAINCEGTIMYSSMYDSNTLASLWVVTDLEHRSTVITRVPKNSNIIGLSYNCPWVK